MFRGSTNDVVFNHREIIKLCLRDRASFLITAHNHPTGNRLPSDSDVETAVKLKRCLEHIDVILVDDLVVAGNDITSIHEIMNYADLFGVAK